MAGPARLLLVALAVSVAVGTRPVDLSVTWSVLPHAVTGDIQSVSGVPALDAAVVESRVWRTAAGVLTGAALAVAGALLQGATRNPLGDPGILGLTAGAACAWSRVPCWAASFRPVLSCGWRPSVPR
nr:iron chelate uptake ABC transporter family permease subunit [Kocuria atrinae]